MGVPQYVSGNLMLVDCKESGQVSRHGMALFAGASTGAIGEFPLVTILMAVATGLEFHSGLWFARRMALVARELLVHSLQGIAGLSVVKPSLFGDQPPCRVMAALASGPKASVV
jgi:hypothetical protein